MAERPGPPGAGDPRAALLATGVLSLLGQVALLRELAVASFGVELVYLVGLSLWLLAGAAGAALGRRRPGAAEPGTGPAFLALALAIPLGILFLRGSRILLGGIPGAYLPLGRQALTAAAGVVPAGAVLGLLFRRAARAAVARGTGLAAAYGWESAGGAAGSVAATLALHVGAGNLALGLLCGAASAAAALPGRAVRRPAAALLVLLALLLPFAPAAERRTTALSHPGLAAVAETPYGRVAVARSDGQAAVFVNDALAYETEGTEAEAFVHLAALQVPPGARVLVLGGTVTGIAAEAARHAPAAVDFVEPNRALYRAVLPHLPGEVRRALARPSARVVFDDPRLFLSRAGTYDLVLVAAPEPASGESNRFYTEEFFRLCAARLAPGGVVALRLPSSENFWTPALLARNGSVHAALSRAFPDVLVVPGGTDTLLASRGRLERDPGVLGERLAARGIEGRLVTPAHLRYLLTNDRVEQAARLLAGAGTPPNRDASPVCYRLAAVLWLGMFDPGIAGAAGGSRRSAAGAAAGAVALVLLARLRPSWRRPGLVAAAGFAGMTVEAAVLLRFQAESGSLYRDIGILLTAFMLGLAAGAFAVDRLYGPGVPPRRRGAWILGGMALLSGSLALAADHAGGPFRLVPASAILFAAGAFVAGAFGHASRGGGDPGEAAGPLYAADLAGGCLGALLSGLLLVPLLGVAGTAAATAALCVAALALL